MAIPKQRGEQEVDSWLRKNYQWSAALLAGVVTVGSGYYSSLSELAALRRDIDANTKADADYRSFGPSGLVHPSMHAGLDLHIRKYAEEFLESKQRANERWNRLFDKNPSLVRATSEPGE